MNQDFSQLDKPIQFLKGVGPKRSETFGRMGIPTARHLLYHVPRRYDDASTVQPVGSLEIGIDATAVGRVRSKGIIPTRRGLRIFQAVLEDETGMITCAWPGQPWLDRRIRKGDLLLVTGTVKFFHGRQLQPREFTLLGREGEDDESPGTIFVSYPASEDVPQWVLRRIFSRNLDWLLAQVEAEEYLDAPERDGLGLMALSRALTVLHRPTTLDEVEEGRRRLAFDELFFLQLVQAQVRFQQTEAQPGISFERTNEHIRPLHESLPFQLTDAQAAVLKEIFADMASPRRMNRLLQGDVGSGKTVVALFAMLLALESGYQAALMAPTEILAEQHAHRLREMLDPLGIDLLLLTGRLGVSDRKAALEALASGSVPLAVGTHALIQEGVDFHRLGLVIVDEQHRFGVRQRMALGERETQRETRPDVLVMSATPIPRSLAMALYGDLDLSVLDELPPGRKPVDTLLKLPAQRNEVYRFLEAEMGEGRQVYVVYPLVEESEKVDLRSATEEAQRLSEEIFPNRRVGLIHGQLPSAEKEAVMRGFLDRDLDLLVATTVIEVGIDVPNASVMVVEHAERFGLSQLHQLRGRVGRGANKSTCILISQPGELAEERLKIFRSTNDGFEIARADLAIRGQGDLFGSQQHGRDPILRFADLSRDEELLRLAQVKARRRVEQDPELEAPENRKISWLLRARHEEKLRMFGVG